MDNIKPVTSVANAQTLQKSNMGAIMPLAPLQRADLEKMERQMIPLLNTVREQLGKPPIIVPK